MMRKKVAGAVLVASVVGGVAVGVAASAMTADEPPRATAKKTQPQALPDVEVRDPQLVLNTDGTATLSTTLVNHTEGELGINQASTGLEVDYEAPLLLHFSDTDLQPGVPAKVGEVGGHIRLRTRDRVQVGSTLPVTVEFLDERSRTLDVTVMAPVVARTAQHADVADNGPNTDIHVRDAKIVVVPGQEKAYVAGWIETTIKDGTDVRPTAIGPRGESIDYRHQTATGGPSGVFATPGEENLIGYSPYLDQEPHGDADYVRAKDVTVGETVTVTMQFPSGDVVTRFRVVQGNPDGTI